MQPHPAVASPARQRTLNKPRPTSAAVSICTEHGLRQSSGSNPAAGAGGSPPWHLGWIGTGAGCEVERSQVGRPPAPSAPQPEGIPSFCFMCHAASSRAGRCRSPVSPCCGQTTATQTLAFYSGCCPWLTQQGLPRAGQWCTGSSSPQPHPVPLSCSSEVTQPALVGLGATTLASNHHAPCLPSGWRGRSQQGRLEGNVTQRAILSNCSRLRTTALDHVVICKASST